MLSALVTTAAGALSATVGVLVGGVLTRRAQDDQWLRDQQVVVYQELLGHFAKFTMILKRAHADRSGWDYDWGEWSAVLTRASLVADEAVALEIDIFGKTVETYLGRVARGSDPARDPLTDEEFLQAGAEAAQAQVRLVNAMRRSLRRKQKDLPFWIGGAQTHRPPDR